jgi:hypothetical protein
MKPRQRKGMVERGSLCSASNGAEAAQRRTVATAQCRVGSSLHLPAYAATTAEGNIEATRQSRFASPITQQTQTVRDYRPWQQFSPFDLGRQCTHWQHVLWRWRQIMRRWAGPWRLSRCLPAGHGRTPEQRISSSKHAAAQIPVEIDERAAPASSEIVGCWVFGHWEALTWTNCCAPNK